MNTFPENSPRKQIDIRWACSVAQEVITIQTTGVEVTPFVIHKKWCQKTGKPMKKGLWQVTHLFTGKGIDVQGSYKYCKAVAQGLMDEPLLWLPCESMWSGHPDVPRVSRKLNELKQINESLGRWL